MTSHDDFDLDRSTEQAWVDFGARLAEVLSMMDSTEPLTVSTQDGDQDVTGYIKFVAPSRDRLLALVPDNPRLPDDHHLTAGQTDELIGAGWRPPSPETGDEASTHYWVEGSQGRSEELAQLAVRALRQVFGVHHPVFLASDVLAEILHAGPVEDDLGAVVSPVAGLDPLEAPDEFAAVLPTNAAHLGVLVQRLLRGMPEITPMRDAEGDLAIRVGSAMVFVRVPADGLEVLVFAPVVHDIDGRSRAAEVLNDINAHARWVRFSLLRDRVFVAMSILARPFVPAHLRQAIAEVCKVADGVDDLLAQSLHGRTTFTDDE
ncbi:MAG: YbjN domain-containing protein [Propionibacteriaceae bacterium]|jgi:hypothetical protein|nr:YbjN domain-containing protein [Propionibacteriaceae bacterium]